MCYIVFISHSLHWRYVKIALQEYVIKASIHNKGSGNDFCLLELWSGKFLLILLDTLSESITLVAVLLGVLKEIPTLN